MFVFVLVAVDTRQLRATLNKVILSKILLLYVSQIVA